MAPSCCSVLGCLKPIHARDWCRMHYERWHKRGDPLAVKPHHSGPRGPQRPRNGGHLGYVAAHEHVSDARGKASEFRCGCGRAAQEWAYDHADPGQLTSKAGRTTGRAYSIDPGHYVAMCASCHRKFDLHRERG